MKWFVYNERNGKIEPYNIFNHSCFVKYVKQHIKNCDIKEDFEQVLKSELRYYFWCKAECELVITSWTARINMNELDRLNAEREEFFKRNDKDPYSLYVIPTIAEKIDVYDQVMLNWDVFVDYVWDNKEELLDVR
jgi:hypothetical protein